MQFYKAPPPPINPRQVTQNVFIITIDGVRWQEIFTGADSLLLNDEQYTPDAATLNSMYWSTTSEERRKKLLPFFWNVIAAKGQLYGNRNYKNRMNVANSYAKSYPGYNEILTGIDDPEISSNQKIQNPNINILEYLDKQPAFAGKVAAFSSWDVFPYILNSERNKMVINAGYQQYDEQSKTIISSVENGVYDKQATRYDDLTFITAKEYIKKKLPRVVLLGFGETDEFAHDGRYDLYLEQAAKVDKMIAELWHWVQTTPGYKDNTTFIITTDHGRGSKKSKWTSHGEFIKGSSQTWMAVLGPHLEPLGEVKEPTQIYQQQIAQTVAHLTGLPFENEEIAPAIVLK